MILKYSVGLDVSSTDIKCCLTSINHLQEIRVLSKLTIPNQKAGFLKAANWMDRWHQEKELPLVICMEATGVYHENCGHFLYDQGYLVSVVLPNKAKKYLQSLGLKSKNDEMDAQGLSYMGAAQKLPYWQPIVKFYALLRILTRQYQSLQEQITGEANRLHAATYSAYQSKFGMKQTTKMLSFLKKQLHECKAEIEKHCASNADAKSKFTEVCKIHGISILSAATVIAESNGFELFENFKQVVSFAGYDVIENQSGKHSGKTKISKQGNSRIRRILHMPALTAMQQKESKFGQLYERVSRTSGVKMKGVVAVQKKLLVMIYYIWKKDLVYNPNFGNLPKEEQTLSSGLALQKPGDEITIINPKNKAKKKDKKLAITSMAKQGKHSVSDHKTPPLGRSKIEKKIKKLIGF